MAEECNNVSPNGQKALQVVADVTKDEDCIRLIQSTIDKFGKIDILVNNAGAGAFSSLNDPKIMEVYERIMKLDVRSVVYLTHLAVPYLEKTKGVIINISSVAGLKPVRMINYLRILLYLTNELLFKRLAHFSSTVWLKVH